MKRRKARVELILDHRRQELRIEGYLWTPAVRRKVRAEIKALERELQSLDDALWRVNQLD